MSETAPSMHLAMQSHGLPGSMPEQSWWHSERHRSWALMTSSLHSADDVSHMCSTIISRSSSLLCAGIAVRPKMTPLVFASDGSLLADVSFAVMGVLLCAPTCELASTSRVTAAWCSILAAVPSSQILAIMASLTGCGQSEAQPSIVAMANSQVAFSPSGGSSQSSTQASSCPGSSMYARAASTNFTFDWIWRSDSAWALSSLWMNLRMDSSAFIGGGAEGHTPEGHAWASAAAPGRARARSATARGIASGVLGAESDDRGDPVRLR